MADRAERGVVIVETPGGRVATVTGLPANDFEALRSAHFLLTPPLMAIGADVLVTVNGRRYVNDNDGWRRCRDA